MNPSSSSDQNASRHRGHTNATPTPYASRSSEGLMDSHHSSQVPNNAVPVMSNDPGLSIAAPSQAPNNRSTPLTTRSLGQHHYGLHSSQSNIEQTRHPYHYSASSGPSYTSVHSGLTAHFEPQYDVQQSPAQASPSIRRPSYDGPRGHSQQSHMPPPSTQFSPGLYPSTSQGSASIYHPYGDVHPVSGMFDASREQHVYHRPSPPTTNDFRPTIPPAISDTRGEFNAGMHYGANRPPASLYPRPTISPPSPVSMSPSSTSPPSAGPSSAPSRPNMGADGTPDPEPEREGGPYVCKVCKTTCSRKNDLGRHMRDKHSPEKHKETCPWCGTEVGRMDALKRHMRVSCKKSPDRFAGQSGDGDTGDR